MYPQTILELDDDEGQKERGCEDPDSPCLHIEGSRPKLDENRSYDRRYSDVEIVDIALYNLKTDPQQLHNIKDQPGTPLPSMLLRLKAYLQDYAWRMKYNKLPI